MLVIDIGRSRSFFSRDDACRRLNPLSDPQSCSWLSEGDRTIPSIDVLYCLNMVRSFVPTAIVGMSANEVAGIQPGYCGLVKMSQDATVFRLVRVQQGNNLSGRET
jgi:hypothetical protein